MAETDKRTAPSTVGVIGGLGPAATLDFFAKVLELTPAVRDQDHLHLIINNNPRVPDRNEAVAGTGPPAGPALAAAGADLLVMACNTAHAFEAEIRAATDVPFLSLIDVTALATLERAPGVRRVGVLAASGCLQAGLYQSAFARAGVETLAPRGESPVRFMTALYDVKAGNLGAVRAPMLELADELVAGCTEVPLVLSDRDIPVPIVDPTLALVQAVVDRAYRPVPHPQPPDPKEPA